MRRIVFFLILLLCAALSSSAQNFTTVTGTITDTNGLPYSNARVTAEIVPAGSNPTIPPPCGGQTSTRCAISGFTQATADVNGTFSMNLASNAVILPGATQWRFTVNEIGVPPPLGTGSQSCVATLTISGASQSVSTSLNTCPALSHVTGGVGPLVPASLITSGLVAQYPLTEGSGTTIADISGFGNNGTLGGGGNAPTWIAGTQGLQFNGGQFVSLPASLNGSLTIQVIMGFQNVNATNAGFTGSTASNNQTVIGGNTGLATSMNWVLFQNPVAGDTWGQEMNGGFTFRTTTTVAAQYKGSTSCVFNGTTSAALVLGSPNDIFYIEGTRCPDLQLASSVGLQSAGNLQLGGSATPGFFTGQIYYVLIYNRALTAQEIGQNNNFLQQTMGARAIAHLLGAPLTDNNNQWVVDGDSITQQVGWAFAGSQPPLLALPSQYADMGLSGTNLTTILTNSPLKIGPLYRPAALQNIVINWGGSNDLDALPAATMLANLRAYCGLYRPLGYKCLATTVLDRLTHVLAHDVYDDFLRQEWPTFADGLIDMAANARLGADGANANATYFNGDGIHPTPFANSSIITPYYVHAINRTYGNTLSSGVYNVYKGSGLGIPTLTQPIASCPNITSANPACTFTYNNSAGNLLVLRFMCQICTGITINTVTDTRANTWNAIGALTTYNASNGGKMQAFYAMNSGAGANTVTIALTGGTGQAIYIDMLEVRGILVAAALDTNSVIASGVSAAPAAANITTTTAGDFLFAFGAIGADPCTLAGSPQWTAANGYTGLTGFTFAAKATASLGLHPLMTQIAGAAGTYSTSATLSTSCEWGLGVAAFKPQTAVTSTFDLQDVDIYAQCDPAGGNTGLNLPDATWMTGQPVTVKNIQTAGANTCIVNGVTPNETGVAQTIDGSATFTIPNNGAVTFIPTLTFTGVAGTNRSPLSNWRIVPR